MKQKSIMTVFLGIFILFSFPQPGNSDEVNLKNGDKITGTVLSLSKGMLGFSTSYSKKVEIQKDQIKSLETKNSVRVQLNNGWKIKGKLREN